MFPPFVVGLVLLLLLTTWKPSLKMVRSRVVSGIRQLFSLEHNDLISYYIWLRLWLSYLWKQAFRKIYGSISHVLKPQLFVLFYEECFFFFYRKAKIKWKLKSSGSQENNVGDSFTQIFPQYNKMQKWLVKNYLQIWNVAKQSMEIWINWLIWANRKKAIAAKNGLVYFWVKQM